MNSQRFAIESTSVKIRSLQQGKSPHVVVVNGFLSQDLNVPERDWLGCLNTHFAEHSQSLVEWESQSEFEFFHRLTSPQSGKMLEEGIKALFNQPQNLSWQNVQQGLRDFSEKTGLADLWEQARRHALGAGEELAQVIGDSSSQSRFVLMAHSLGALLVTQCLKELVGFPERKIQVVHLLGGAVSQQAFDFETLSKVSQQGVFNYFSGRDMILQLGYNQLLQDGKAIGSAEVVGPFAKWWNVDVSQTVVEHLMFKQLSQSFLRI